MVLLHGWPGDRTDYRALAPLLAPSFDVVVPDLRGFGESDKHVAEPAVAYGADGQARSVVGLVEELGLDRPVFAGYDIGSRIAQAIARNRPDVVGALVISPPLPGVGTRVLAPRPSRSSGTSTCTAWTWPSSWSTGRRGRCGPTCGTSGRTGPGRTSR